MPRSFSETMSALRQERGLSQRTAAAGMHISQALLSHYERGAREPGLDFVCRACGYYGVSADYMLGITEERGGGQRSAQLRELLEELQGLTNKVEHALEELEP